MIRARTSAMAILLATLLFTHLASAQDPAVAAGEYQVAPVTLDGHTLFSVRGISALPAEERAAGISQRIKATASDANISQDSIRLLSGEHYSSIIAGSVTLM